MTSNILTTATTDSMRWAIRSEGARVRYVIPGLKSGYTYTVKPHPPTPREDRERG
jgi:hypothetical protein